MGDEAMDERDELTALRLRAYGPDADIDRDPVAMARLSELENRGHLSPADVEPAPAGTGTTVPVGSAPAAVTPETVTSAPIRIPRPRRRSALIAGAASAVVIAVIAVAWSMTPPTPETTEPIPTSSPPTTQPHSWASSAYGYEQQRLTLRERALSGSNAASSSELTQLDVDSLQPKGTFVQRSVWVGESIDGATCLVLGGDDGPIITCAEPSWVDGLGLSVLAPSVGAGDSAIVTDSPVAESSAQVRFTLHRDGSVTAEPAAPR